MFDIKVKNEQIEFARNFVNTHDLGQRGYGDGTKEQQFTGILGQIVLTDLLEMDRPTGDGFDGGFDFVINNRRVDIKTMGRTTEMRDYYVHNFIAYQKNYTVDYYIFASFNKTNNVLTICGCIDKANFKKRAEFYEKGTLRYRSDGTSFETKGPLYEIKQTKIYSVNSIGMLKKIIL